MGLSENFEEQRQPFDESKSITDNKDSSLVTLNKKWSLANSKIIPRETWTNTFEFILSCIGYSVGLGNIWRFPYLCYQNGGGAFLIPYVISLVFCGIPMFVLEASWGQLLSIGGLGMWELCPILKGAGIAATVCAFWLNIYYIVVLAWALIYFFYSFYNVPWGDCNNWWNTEKCVPEYGCRSLNETLKTFYNTSNLSQHEISNFNLSLLPTNLTLCNENSTQAVREFWERNVLHISNGIEEPGSIIWQLSLALFVAWALCYFAIFKGIKWTGKVSLFLELEMAFTFIWLQIFQNSPIPMQAALICILDSSTSFFTGFVVFSFIGYMAYEQNQPVDQVAMSGPGLLFLAYPSGILKLPGAAVWSALFFLMVILIGIDSQFCTMEGFFTALIDEFPRIFRRKYGREIFIFIICFLSYLIGLSMTCEGGMYVFKIFDFYGASGWVLLWLLFFECIAISWCYGLNKWYENLKDMVGYYPSLWWKFCWGFSCPAVCFGVTLFSLIKYEGPKYPNYTFPTWAHVIGWLMSISSMICIPVYAIYLYIATPGSFRHKMKILVSPDVDIAALRFSNCCDALPMSEADTTTK
ncbi:Sodium- and chloride-dependent GABA transporter 1 [Trichinella pseudospiralis]|uniref:Transporter n=1 Tax=Trichinella pseudospiralis TaxID=6337 RepID=A0A0V1J8V9_TRIPS|nr:Sodium- and chloride-dependent GABA transporter 1 [Trichinella pseudospiralis]